MVKLVEDKPNDNLFNSIRDLISRYEQRLEYANIMSSDSQEEIDFYAGISHVLEDVIDDLKDIISEGDSYD